MCKRVILSRCSLIISLVGYILAFTSVCSAAPFSTPESKQAVLDQINAAIKAKGASWTAGETSVSNRPLRELCGYVGLDKTKKQSTTIQPSSSAVGIADALPATWDWRNKDGHDWTTPVKDQGGCGACYIFAACATAEHCMKVQSGPDGWMENPNLSEQHILSCTDFTCAGGATMNVLNYLTSTGTTDDACFPYTGSDATPCENRCPSWESRMIKLHNWGDPEPNGRASVEQIKQAVMEYGSVAAGFAVMSDFRNYTSGVYEYVWGEEEAGHGITIIGWDDSLECWICKNSWGTNWGETRDFQPFTWGAGDGGYFRIKWEQCWIGDGACYAIGTLPNFPKANLTKTQLSGWSNPIVPRNSAGATSSSCTYSSALDGLTANTYINFSGINNGNRNSESFVCKTYVDGEEKLTTNFSGMSIGQAFNKVNGGPISVKGGRHTLKVILDADDHVFESDETITESPYDNVICQQFVWSPTQIGKETTIVWNAPPQKEWCQGSVGYYNCDGFSFPVGNTGNYGYWSAVGVLPVSSANYAVQLYDRGTYSGVFNGFDQNFLADSQESAESCHYVLVNTRKTSAGTYYAGVVNASGSSADYCATHATSVPIQSGPSAQWDEIYNISSFKVMELYEVYLTPGSYGFNLKHVDGSAALGMALFDCNLPSGARGNAMISAQGTTAGSRSFTYDINIAGYYALAVYKTRTIGASQTASYKLSVARASICVTSPNGGESVGLGEIHKIYWQSFGNAGSNVKIELSRTGGSTWTTLANSTPNTGEYNWTVSGAISNHCKVRVTSLSDSSFTDTSDGQFSIVSRWISIVGPLPGETLELNFPYPVGWSSQNVIGNVKIELSTDSGATWETIAGDWPNGGMMFWYVTGPASTHCRMRISSVNAPTCYDESTSDFTISGPAINVTSPTGDNNWMIGETQTITWNSMYLSGNVKIEISRDAGATWTTLVADTPNDGSHTWTVTGPDSQECKIRVRSVGTSYVFGTSDGLFDIVTPSITVTSPRPGVGYYLPNGIVIGWNSVPMAGDVKIELSRDNGTSWEVLTASTTNDGEYVWSPSTGPNSTQCLIKVSNADMPAIFDVTDGTFKITGKYVVVTSPNGGETVYAGEARNITWTSEMLDGFMQAELSRDGGATWALIRSLLPNSGSCTWTPEEPLSNQCRVRVTSLDFPNVKDTSNADFTIAKRQITIITPNGGEKLCIGTTKEIRWSSTNVPGKIIISLSRDGGQTWSIIHSSNLNLGKYTWTVNSPASTNCLIKVYSLTYPASDTSDGAFEIGLSALDVTYPNGGEVLTAGSTADITWNSCGITSNVDIALSRDGGVTWTTIISDTPNDGTEPYTVTSPDSVNCRVRVTPTGNPTVADISDEDFKIITRTITVTYPNGGERWVVGKPVNITWHSANLSGPVKIEITRNRGISYTILSSNWATPGIFPWTVASPLSSRCRIRVTSVDYPTVNDLSNADFGITDVYLDVTYPNGGEVLTNGQSYNITWNQNNMPPGDCKIDLSRDGGGTWSRLFSNVPNTGSQAWTPSISPSTRCRIRVTSLADDLITDISDAEFSVVTRRITVSSPNGGEVWGIGHQKNITWTSSNLAADEKLTIELSRNGGSTYTTLASNILNSGTLPWTVTAPGSTNCLVRITSQEFASLSDTGNSVFTIADVLTIPCQVTLKDWTPSPAGMEVQVEIRNPGGSTPLETHTIVLGPNGTAQFTTTLKMLCDMTFKASHWLRATVSDVDIAVDMPIVQVSLTNGDCNGDDQINEMDAEAVANYWARTFTMPSNTDLNGDGRCDAFDLAIINRNWGGKKDGINASGGCTMWFGDEDGNPIQAIETVAGEPFEINVWATTTTATWFINAAVAFDAANSEGSGAVPLLRDIDLADGNPEIDLVWGEAISSYTIPLQKELCGFYKQSGGTRGYGANFACALVPGSLPAANRIHVAKLTLRHRMDSGGTASVVLWDDATNTAGCLNTMAFGTSPIYGMYDSVDIRAYIADTIPEAKSAANLDAVEIRGAAVTAAFPDVFYIETDDRNMGIMARLDSHWIEAGDRVDIFGWVDVNEDGEKYIEVNDFEIDGTSDIRPVAMANYQLGGGGWNYNPYTGAGQAGVTGGVGLNNIGLLVRVFGRFERLDNSTFTIDDGSGVSVRCTVPAGVYLNPNWNFVTVTGISSCRMAGGALERLVLVREQNDIVGY